MKTNQFKKYLVPTALMTISLVGFQNCSNKNFESAASLVKANTQIVNTQVMPSRMAQSDSETVVSGGGSSSGSAASSSTSSESNNNSSNTSVAASTPAANQPVVSQPAQQQPVLSATDYNARMFLGCKEWNQLTGRNTVCALVCNRYTGEGCQNTNPSTCIDIEAGGFKFYSYADGYSNKVASLPYFKQDGNKQTYVRLASDDNDCRGYRYFDKYIADGGTTPDGKRVRAVVDMFTADELFQLGYSPQGMINVANDQINRGKLSCYPQGRADCSKPEI